MDPTLIDVLQQRFPDSSKTTLRKMLAGDRVRVNGAPERDAKRVISAHDRVEIAPKAARPIDPRVRILYEDDDLIVVDKAAGLLTVPSPEVLHETAESFLNLYLGGWAGEGRVHHVHRLDRDTSGVLVFAKNTWVRDRLQELFAAHDIERIYVAIVHGKLREPFGTFRSFLAEDRDLRVRSVRVVPASRRPPVPPKGRRDAGTTREGKEAVTHYRTIASGRRYSILEVTLESGRRNQIRVHLAEAGHPIVGDTMYGKGREDDLGRLALHAKHLAFVHPRTGAKVTFKSEMPRQFRELSL